MGPKITLFIIALVLRIDHFKHLVIIISKRQMEFDFVNYCD